MRRLEAACVQRRAVAALDEQQVGHKRQVGPGVKEGGSLTAIENNSVCR